MPKHSGVNTKAMEAIQRRKEQKELAAQIKEQERLDKLWQDDDKLNKAKLDRKNEQLRKHQEKLEKRAELRKLIEREESELTSNKKLPKGSPVPKVTRAECLKNQLLQMEKQKDSLKEEEYLVLNDGELMANENHQLLFEQLDLEDKNVDLIAGYTIHTSGIDNVLSSLQIDKEQKSLKTTYMGFQERKMAELKEEYPNLKLSQYKDMIYKLVTHLSNNYINDNNFVVEEIA
ncbi:uncharacterized protein TA07710 [Theileria annulata]|uniref:Coiled-coil domain-containing protein n=1 Tax=Theileria annulata TaxID=5874 RepID=Q4UA08_THEAN|nr:uncharacterized protein TA07710 [Theileria annulata]CAI76345.1 hypothetical protein, conserved [Theileria annulata]|eukprot:XP_952969.1 hypothetical protein, conserved [Theileria annulata]